MELTITNNFIYRSQAVNGGSIYLNNIKQGEIIQNKFLKNKATHNELINEFINSKSGRGGVIYINSTQDIDIKSLKFKNNLFDLNLAEIGSIIYFSQKIHNLKPESKNFGIETISITKIGFLINRFKWISKIKPMKIYLKSDNYYEKCIIEFAPINKRKIIDTTEIKKLAENLLIFENEKLNEKLISKTQFYKSFPKFLV